MPDTQTADQPALNNWNPSLGDEATNLIKQSIGAMQNQMPFLIGLTAQERKRHAKIGDRTRTFVSDAVQTALANPGVLPRSVDPDQLRDKANTMENLRSVQLELRKFDELLTDTQTLLGADVYGMTRSVYSVLKTPATPPGLKTTKEALGQRFKRKKNRQTEVKMPLAG